MATGQQRTYAIVTASLDFPVGVYTAHDAEEALDLFVQDLETNPLFEDVARTAQKFFEAASGTDGDVKVKIGASVYSARAEV